MTKRSDTPSSPGTDDLLPTRQSLLQRLKDWEDDLGWQEFFDTYWRLIYNVAHKAGLSPAESEEVVQETVLSVAKAMKTFQYRKDRGSFKGWLLQLTGWRIRDQLRKRQFQGLTPGTLDQAESPSQLEPAVEPDLAAIWDQEWEGNLLQAAIQKVRRQIKPGHFQIFDLCVNQGRSMAEVGKFLGVSMAAVYVSRHRVGRMVQQEVRRLRQSML